MKADNIENSSKRLIYFFLISHGIPYLITVVFMLLDKSFYISNPVFAKLIYIALLSPTYAALFVLYAFYNKKERKHYWLSVVDFKRIPVNWYLVILGFPILVTFLGAVIDAGLGLNNFEFKISPEMTIAYAALLLFFGPIPEELGWRGIALPELKRKYSFAAAVLFLGFMWAIWHLPLFFVQGTYQYQLGLLTPLFWQFIFRAVTISVIYGVIYFETNKSILAVILFHFFGNLAGETFVTTFNAQVISTALQGIAALACLIYYRKQM